VIIMATFYSPNGNPEVWQKKPDGYYTPEEWAALHPPSEPTFDELKEFKLQELVRSFDARITGAITVQPFGYVMQFNTDDSIKMQGAIDLMEITGQTVGYLTQANDVTVYDVPIDVMKNVLVQMMTAFAACHSRKQELRSAINDAETKEDLAAIEITWPV